MGYTQNKNYIDKKDLEHFWVAEAINTKQDKALSNEVAEALSGDGAEVRTLDDALLRLNEKAGTGGGGEPGFSPTVEVSKTDKVTTVTITDKTGVHTATINDGEDGTNGTDGEPGAKGDKGEDGVSPTISAVRVSNGVQLTITDKNGSHTAVINDGIGDGSTVATFADVPSDGKSYLRQNGIWVEGATKAEIATIGSKVGELDTELNGKSIQQPTEIPNYSINVSGVMSANNTQKHVVVDVSRVTGEKITSSYGVQYAFLATYDSTSGSTSTFAEGCERITGTPTNIDIPSGANWLYVYLGTGSTLPIPTISVTGTNRGLIDEIGKNTEDIASLNTSIDAIAEKIENIDDVTKIATKEHITEIYNLSASNDLLTRKDKFYANYNGWVPNNAYYSFYFTAVHGMQVWFDSTTATAFDLCVFNGDVTSDNYVSRYRKSENNLPTETNKLTISAGQTVVFSMTPTYVFEAKASYAIDEYTLKNNLTLGDAQIQQVKDSIDIKGADEIGTFTTDSGTTELTADSSNLTLKDKYVANYNGWVANNDYHSFYFTAGYEIQLWFNSTTASNFDICIYNGEVSATNYVTRYRKADNTLPNEGNKLTIQEGQTVVFSLTTMSFSVWQSYTREICTANSTFVLGDAQIQQVKDNLPIDGSALMYAEKTTTALNIYKKNSKGKYIKYPLEYRYKTFTSGEYPSYYDNFGIGVVSECNFTNDTMIEGTALFSQGEAEFAINVPESTSSNTRYVGGSAHGFENIVNGSNGREIRILVDGESIAENATFALKRVRHIDVMQHTELCQAYANTDPFIDVYKHWVFDEGERMNISTKGVFKTAINVTYCQMGMFCVFRHQSGNASRPYITNRVIMENNPFKIHDVSDGWNIPEIKTPNNDCDMVSEYGELGYGFSMQISNDNRKQSGGMFVSTNNNAYNKIYFVLGCGFRAVIGEEIKATQTWFID